MWTLHVACGCCIIAADTYKHLLRLQLQPRMHLSAQSCSKVACGGPTRPYPTKPQPEPSADGGAPVPREAPVKERNSHAAAVLNRQLYVFGGDNNGDLLREFAAADTTPAGLSSACLSRQWEHLCSQHRAPCHCHFAVRRHQSAMRAKQLTYLLCNSNSTANKTLEARGKRIRI
jgi:hypothetical protein